MAWTKKERRVARIEEPSERIPGVDHTADWTQQVAALSEADLEQEAPALRLTEATRTADWTDMAADLPGTRAGLEQTADWSDMADETATIRRKGESTLDWSALLED